MTHHPWPNLDPMKTDPHPQPLTPEQQRIFDAVPLRSNDHIWGQVAATATAASPRPAAALDLEALKRLLGDVPPEPIGEWMREQGFPPESSVLYLPLAMRDQLPFWPRYVEFSASILAPMLTRSLSSFKPWPAGVPEVSGGMR